LRKELIGKYIEVLQY